MAIATAAKAKLLHREIKTVKADLAFAKERSCQFELEEENKILREASENPADNDMVFNVGDVWGCLTKLSSVE